MCIRDSDRLVPIPERFPDYSDEEERRERKVRETDEAVRDPPKNPNAKGTLKREYAALREAHETLWGEFLTGTVEKKRLMEECRRDKIVIEALKLENDRLREGTTCTI